MQKFLKKNLAKKDSVFVYVCNFNVSLTNHVVSFEQPGPE